MPPTGIMIHLAKECDHDNVKKSSYVASYIHSYSLWVLCSVKTVCSEDASEYGTLYVAIAM